MSINNTYEPLDGLEEISDAASVDAKETVTPKTPHIPPI